MLLFRAGLVTFFEGQPPSSCCFQDIPYQETWAEAQSKCEASPVISWLFLAGPAGASEASRGVAGAELLVWPVWLEKLRENITRRKIFLVLDSPNLVGIVGFVATPLAHTQSPFAALTPTACTVSFSRMFLQVNSCSVSSAFQFLPLPQKGCKEIICVPNMNVGEGRISCTEGSLLRAGKNQNQRRFLVLMQIPLGTMCTPHRFSVPNIKQAKAHEDMSTAEDQPCPVFRVRLERNTIQHPSQLCAVPTPAELFWETGIFCWCPNVTGEDCDPNLCRAQLASGSTESRSHLSPSIFQVVYPAGRPIPHADDGTVSHATECSLSHISLLLFTQAALGRDAL